MILLWFNGFGFDVRNEANDNKKNKSIIERNQSQQLYHVVPSLQQEAPRDLLTKHCQYQTKTKRISYLIHESYLAPNSNVVSNLNQKTSNNEWVNELSKVSLSLSLFYRMKQKIAFLKKK